MKISQPLLALLATALPASAQVQTPSDLRVHKVLYQPDVVTVVSARPDFETMISFAPDERIENVAVGDSISWQVAPNKRSDLLFVKPVAVDAHTNMAVITDRRAYLFELRSDDAAGPLMYNLRFSYLEAAPAQPGAAPAPVVRTAWQASGSAALRPARTYDDGRSVFLSWPKGKPLPAVLAVDDKGHEEPLNFTARDEYLVTDAVPARILVRVGTDQAVLVPRPAHADPRAVAER